MGEINAVQKIDGMAELVAHQPNLFQRVRTVIVVFLLTHTQNSNMRNCRTKSSLNET